jgi:hypothetical protein
MKSLLILGSVVALISFAPAAAAKSSAEIEQIAKAVSVEILDGVGSGVIIHRQGNLYTAVTNRHVVCKVKGSCNESKSPRWQIQAASRWMMQFIQQASPQGKAGYLGRGKPRP